MLCRVQGDNNMSKKYMVLIFVGVCVAALSISAAADEETLNQKIVSREVSSGDNPINEPLVEPVNYEDLIIAPNPDETIEQDNAVEEEYDNLVGEDCDPDTIHILDNPKTEDREYENVVGEDCDQDTPHILGTDNNEENDEETLNNDLSAGTTTEDLEKSNLSIPVVLIVAGVAGLVLVVAVKRK